MLALSAVVHCALAFSGSALLASSRHAGVAAVREAVAHVSMHDARPQRELRVLRTPEVAAIASKNDVRKGKNYKTEIQVPQKRPLIKINTSGMSPGEILQFKIAAGAIAIGVFKALLGLINGAKRSTGPSTSGTDYISTTEAQAAMLRAFKCENCGYELYPARGREGKFFPDSFKCPMCGSPKESFYNMNDRDDPRNWDENGKFIEQI